MDFRYKITFKLGHLVKAEVLGEPKSDEHLTIKDVGERIIETEQYLEKITGLRVHIDQVN
jgi:hypothetical protein